ncbi:MAG: enoyl-CoA hydratase/isomerase family protein, partial [Granulosicoccaceae bacterium]
LTGARLNAFDACFVGFADRILSSAQRLALQQALVRADWSADHFAAVDGVLKTLESEAAVTGESPIREHFDLIQQLTDYANLVDTVRSINDYQTTNTWIARAQKSLAH